MEETVGGFIVGSILGVIFGLALGRSRLLADVMGPCIKAANAIPRVRLVVYILVTLRLNKSWYIRSLVYTKALYTGHR